MKLRLVSDDIALDAAGELLEKISDNVKHYCNRHFFCDRIDKRFNCGFVFMKIGG